MTTLNTDELRERLRRGAEASSSISRQMAEDKSLRQESNTERRTDLYAWAKPEQTTEGQALAAIDTLLTEITELRRQVEVAREAANDGSIALAMQAADELDTRAKRDERMVGAVIEICAEERQQQQAEVYAAQGREKRMLANAIRAICKALSLLNGSNTK